jgi:large-conductance mechanosensitive channel
MGAASIVAMRREFRGFVLRTDVVELAIAAVSRAALGTAEVGTA